MRGRLARTSPQAATPPKAGPGTAGFQPARRRTPQRLPWKHSLRPPPAGIRRERRRAGETPAYPGSGPALRRAEGADRLGARASPPARSRAPQRLPWKHSLSPPTRRHSQGAETCGRDARAPRKRARAPSRRRRGLPGCAGVPARTSPRAAAFAMEAQSPPPARRHSCRRQRAGWKPAVPGPACGGVATRNRPITPGIIARPPFRRPEAPRRNPAKRCRAGRRDGPAPPSG